MGIFDWFRGAARAAEPFRMPVDDAFALKVPGKVVVVGVVADDEVRPGDRLVLRTTAAEVPVTVEALETHHKPLRAARRDDRIGVMLVGVDKAQVEHGAMLASADAGTGRRILPNRPGEIRVDRRAGLRHP
jgi:selenocysteine-specific translation elongation factor